MAKTALQQLREKLKENEAKYGKLFPQFESWINELLEIEQKQMIDFGQKMQMIDDVDFDREVTFVFNPNDAFSIIYNNQNESVFGDNDPLKFVTHSHNPEQNPWRSISDIEGLKQGHYLVRVKNSFPKNCNVVVAEFDEDAKTFYSESSDYAILEGIEWKRIN